MIRGPHTTAAVCARAADPYSETSDTPAAFRDRAMRPHRLQQRRELDADAQRVAQPQRQRNAAPRPSQFTAGLPDIQGPLSLSKQCVIGNLRDGASRPC